MIHPPNVILLDKNYPEDQIITRAAEILKNGDIMAFPTETVYGLGANALDANAVKKIFTAKGRPSDNPLIVHIAELKDLDGLAANISETAQTLIASFWPGPLTLVFAKKKIVPSEVTAGAETVAVRIPNHPVALELIRKAGYPVAAPSANKAGRPSPTQAWHVYEDFGSEIPLILDAGPTEIGLESTVVDVTGPKAIILRQGGIPKEDLALVLGYEPEVAQLKEGQKAPSPGMKYRHYAPQAPLVLFNIEPESSIIGALQKELNMQKAQGLKVGILCPEEHAKNYLNADKIVPCGSLKNLESIGQNLFACLRQFVPQEIDIILAEKIPSKGVGTAVMDRLQRAASKTVS